MLRTEAAQPFAVWMDGKHIPFTILWGNIPADMDNAHRHLFPNPVILSEVSASLREADTKSKDPCTAVIATGPTRRSHDAVLDRNEFPDTPPLTQSNMGSFDSAGTSLREVPTALRMTVGNSGSPCFRFAVLIAKSSRAHLLYLSGIKNAVTCATHESMLLTCQR